MNKGAIVLLQRQNVGHRVITYRPWNISGQNMCGQNTSSYDISPPEMTSKIKYYHLDLSLSICGCDVTAIIRGCRESCRDTQTIFRLASHLVRTPNSRSGGHEIESPMQKELGALTKSEKILGVRPFWSDDPDVLLEHAAGVIAWSCQKVMLTAWHVTGRFPCLADSLTCPTPRQTILLY